MDDTTFKLLQFMRKRFGDLGPIYLSKEMNKLGYRDIKSLSMSQKETLREALLTNIFADTMSHQRITINRSALESIFDPTMKVHSTLRTREQKANELLRSPYYKSHINYSSLSSASSKEINFDRWLKYLIPAVIIVIIFLFLILIPFLNNQNSEESANNETATNKSLMDERFMNDSSVPIEPGSESTSDDIDDDKSALSDMHENAKNFDGSDDNVEGRTPNNDSTEDITDAGDTGNESIDDAEKSESNLTQPLKNDTYNDATNETSLDNLECNLSNKGKITYIEEDDHFYGCDGKEWRQLD
ncbi:hypothetical protein H6503_04930 [Candidatus Woesearchaeota archaeon]|nr:hypothetical protein [Candidatus Woesearchaeota archaeon]